jgi:hypothetical protein
MSGNNTTEPTYQNKDAKGYALVPTVDHEMRPSCVPEPSSGRPAFQRPIK